MKEINYKNMHLNDGSIIEYWFSKPKKINQSFASFMDSYVTIDTGSIKLIILLNKDLDS